MNWKYQSNSNLLDDLKGTHMLLKDIHKAHDSLWLPQYITFEIHQEYKIFQFQDQRIKNMQSVFACLFFLPFNYHSVPVKNP